MTRPTLEEALGWLDRIQPSCESFHHDKATYHKIRFCPIEDEYNFFRMRCAEPSDESALRAALAEAQRERGAYEQEHEACIDIWRASCRFEQARADAAEAESEMLATALRRCAGAAGAEDAGDGCRRIIEIVYTTFGRRAALVPAPDPAPSQPYLDELGEMQSGGGRLPQEGQE